MCYVSVLESAVVLGQLAVTPPSYPALRSKRWLEGSQDIQPLNPAGTLGNNQLASRVLIEIGEGHFITLVSRRPQPF